MPAILLNADVSKVAAVMPWLVDCKIAGLGGRAGSTATPALLRSAREAGLHTVALVGVLVEWEGEQRRTAAPRALESLRGHAAETVFVCGDAVAERLAEDVTLHHVMVEFDVALLSELDARLASNVSQNEVA